jgi:hypothetical protein
MSLIRGLLRSPGFLIPAVLTIGLGIGVNVVVQRVYATLLEALPYRAPQRLAHIMETQPRVPAYADRHSRLRGLETPQPQLRIDGSVHLPGH